MPARPPSERIVVDANIVLSAILGLKTKPIIALIAQRVHLVTTLVAVGEIRRALAVLDVVPERLAAAEAVLQLVEAVELLIDPEQMARARLSLRNAVASRNGSDADAHLLALAWMLDADIWSHDRDFAGTGWPSWSSANLAAALAEAV